MELVESLLYVEDGVKEYEGAYPRYYEGEKYAQAINYEGEAYSKSRAPRYRKNTLIEEKAEYKLRKG